MDGISYCGVVFSSSLQAVVALLGLLFIGGAYASSAEAHAAAVETAAGLEFDLGNGDVLLVEGESDAQTAWLAGVPAVALPLLQGEAGEAVLPQVLAVVRDVAAALDHVPARGPDIGDGIAEKLREEGVRVPEVIWPFTARRILTVEWIDGTPMGDLAALDRRDPQVAEWTCVGMNERDPGPVGR